MKFSFDLHIAVLASIVGFSIFIKQLVVLSHFSLLYPCNQWLFISVRFSLNLRNISYIIFRDSTGAGNWQLLDSVSNSNFNRTDYPNPNSGTFTIKLLSSSVFGLPSSIKFYNVQGGIIHSAQITTASVNIKLDLSAGIYHVRIITKSGVGKSPRIRLQNQTPQKKVADYRTS